MKSKTFLFVLIMAMLLTTIPCSAFAMENDEPQAAQGILSENSEKYTSLAEANTAKAQTDVNLQSAGAETAEAITAEAQDQEDVKLQGFVPETYTVKFEAYNSQASYITGLPDTITISESENGKWKFTVPTNSPKYDDGEATGDLRYYTCLVGSERQYFLPGKSYEISTSVNEITLNPEMIKKWSYSVIWRLYGVEKADFKGSNLALTVYAYNRDAEYPDADMSRWTYTLKAKDATITNTGNCLTAIWKFEGYEEITEGLDVDYTDPEIAGYELLSDKGNWKEWYEYEDAWYSVGVESYYNKLPDDDDDGDDDEDEDGNNGSSDTGNNGSSDVVNTGDSSNILNWSLIGIISAAAAALTVLYRTRRHE